MSDKNFICCTVIYQFVNWIVHCAVRFCLVN